MQILELEDYNIYVGNDSWQTLNEQVQKTIHRIQPFQTTQNVMKIARDAGIKSINIDLIYGLPHQNRETFKETVKQILTLDPDRLAVFNYAHVPWLMKTMRKFDETTFAPPSQKLEILKDTIEFFTTNGYNMVGMDHFAKPEDELFKAIEKGELHRNFQGYTTQGECDLIGFGVSAISMVGDAYAQNQKELKKYYAQVNELRHALWKGVALDNDDLLRREVIKQLICNFKLDKTQIESEFSVNFNRYFKEDLELLQTFINDELVEVDDKEIRVTLRGRLLIRNICMCFDKYLRAKARQQQFSRVI